MRVPRDPFAAAVPHELSPQYGPRSTVRVPDELSPRYARKT